jgi:hypothetical protein
MGHKYLPGEFDLGAEGAQPFLRYQLYVMDRIPRPAHHDLHEALSVLRHPFGLGLLQLPILVLVVVPFTFLFHTANNGRIEVGYIGYIASD